MDDLISRQAAINKILGQPPEPHYPSWYAEQIKELPSAQPAFDARDTQYNLPIGTDLIRRAQAIDAVKRLSLGETDAVRLAMRIEDYLERLPSALGTNLAEVGTDCISRQKAIEVVRATLIAWSYMPEWRENKIIEAIEQLPPIQPKRGRWIYCEDTTADCVDGYRCDQCGFFVPWDYQHKSIDYIKDYNFCPNCRADMRGEQDG